MLRYMDYAYAVYKEKSFTKAAEKLYISQPSLSLTIKKLEKEIGGPVFERCGKEITLTEIGEKYIKAVEQVIYIKKNFENEIDDLLKLKRGTVIIGSTTFLASYLLPDILKSFHRQYPDIKIDLIVEQSTYLEEKLEEGLVDLVIDNVTSENPGYGYLPLFEEQIFLGVPERLDINHKMREYQITKEEIIAESHRATDLKRSVYNPLPKVNLDSFKAEKFILLKYGNKMRQLSNKMFEESGMSPEISFEFDQLMLSVSYAESGFGICFLTDTILKYGKDCKNLIYYLPDSSHKKRTVYISYKKSKYLTSAAEAFIEHLKNSNL